MSVLIVRQLVKSYKQRQVVKNVSLDVYSGEVVGLLGPNGAGKTTTFYMIVGLIVADGGQVILDDNNITAQPIHIRSHMGLGYLPQEASIFRKLSVEENILAILQYRKNLSKQQQQHILDQLLEDLKITELRKQSATSLSGGERRRLEIARTLAGNPSFILLDEPFAGIDPIAVSNIQEIVTELCERGIGVLITDHNVRETLKICQRAYIINEGEVLAEGDPEHILQHEEVRTVYLGSQFEM